MFYSSCRQHGIASEAMVERALQQIIKEGGEVGRDPVRIVDFSKSPPNGIRDREGIDFIVTLDEAGQIPIQVKSSSIRGKRFERRRRNSRYFIPVVVVNWWENLEKIVMKVRTCIKLVLDIVRRRLNDEIHRHRIGAKKRKQKFRRFHAPCMCH